MLYVVLDERLAWVAQPSDQIDVLAQIDRGGSIPVARQLRLPFSSVVPSDRARRLIRVGYDRLVRMLATVAVCAACSSSPRATDTTTAPTLPDPVVADASEPPVVGVSVDAGPTFVCVPHDRAVTLSSVIDDALRLCWPAATDATAGGCFAFGASGTASPSPEQPELPTIAVHEDDDRAVVACMSPDACVTLRPNLSTWVIADVAIAPYGTEAAIAFEYKESNRRAVVEIWDVENGKLISSELLSAKAQDTSIEVQFLWETLLVTVVNESTHVAEDSLWSTSKDLKRIKRFDVAAQWVALDGGRAARLVGNDLALYDRTTGERVADLEWEKLVTATGSESVTLQIAGHGDALGVVVIDNATRQLVGAGVFSATGEVRPYPLASC